MRLDCIESTEKYRIVQLGLLQDAGQFSIAHFAWRKYGKGRHPAGLNFGDCFAYALAKMSGERLLAKGEYFQRTDLQLL